MTEFPFAMSTLNNIEKFESSRHLSLNIYPKAIFHLTTFMTEIRTLCQM